MGKIVFGSFIHNEELEAKEELGPFVAKLKIDSIRSAMETGKQFKEFRDNELIFLMNTKITPINEEVALVTGDRVRFSKVPF